MYGSLTALSEGTGCGGGVERTAGVGMQDKERLPEVSHKHLSPEDQTWCRSALRGPSMYKHAKISKTVALDRNKSWQHSGIPARHALQLHLIQFNINYIYDNATHGIT